MNQIVFPEIFSANSIGTVIKIFQIIIMVLFLLYSLLTIRQVSIMNHSLITKIRFELKVFAYFQLFLGIGVLILILIR
jgi:hypothetical protein